MSHLTMERKMTYNIKVKQHSHWAGAGFQIIIDKKKYPIERGEYYFPNAETDEEREKKAISWGIAEKEGKYLSRSGIVYNNEKEYLKVINKYE